MDSLSGVDKDREFEACSFYEIGCAQQQGSAMQLKRHANETEFKLKQLLNRTERIEDAEK